MILRPKRENERNYIDKNTPERDVFVMDNDVKNSYKKKRSSFIFVLKYILLTFFLGVTVYLAHSAEMEA